ncbi:MAG: hypothetical protein WC761_03555 [Candidatus Paceibacterota bacterium]|jgi:hypothetical protein
MDTVEKMFGSPIKARLMRAFVYTPNTVLGVDVLAKQVKSRPAAVKKEMKSLRDMKLISERMTKNAKGRKVKGFILNQNFPFLEALREFLFKVSPLTENSIAKKLGTAGKAKLIVISGMFLNNEDARADMLVVSDTADEKKLQKAISEISTEFGRDVSFAVLSSADFTYRMGMGDKLVRDIFDFPHKVILNKIGLEE